MAQLWDELDDEEREECESTAKARNSGTIDEMEKRKLSDKRRKRTRIAGLLTCQDYQSGHTSGSECPHFVPITLPPALETGPSRKRTHMSEEHKRRNRISAQASRDRRKAQLLHLEHQPSAAEGRATGPTQPAPQPNTFILQTSAAPGSGQILHEGHNSSHRSGDASVYYVERTTLPACPDIMSTVKKSASLGKAPNKAAKSKITSSHPPWVDVITVLVFFLAVAPPSASLRAGSSLLGRRRDALSPMRKLTGQDRWSPHITIMGKRRDEALGAGTIFTVQRHPSNVK
ncbi:hypothetical protein B0H14DRAFT_3587284 [Mycena olivaceomarginata]|nr:hypothetical protein B0H14DRAFT_3587284 [Mycena olivaceomarginata]